MFAFYGLTACENRTPTQHIEIRNVKNVCGFRTLWRTGLLFLHRSLSVTLSICCNKLESNWNAAID